MSYIRLYGYSALFVRKYDYCVVLSERITVYDKSFKTIRRISEIKYPSEMQISKNGEYLYVMTTQS